MRLVIICTIVILVTLGLVGFFTLNPIQYMTPQVVQNPAQEETTDPTDAPTKDCHPKLLQAIISPEGTAGSTYAKLEITNIGTTSCQVTLGNTITTKFAASNITIHDQEKKPSETIMLAPSKKIYSQIHYPNGAQCSSGVTEKEIVFFYQTALPFQTKNQDTIKIQTCKSDSEKTVIDIWPVSQIPSN